MPSPRKYALRASCFFSACLRLPDAKAPWFTAKTDSAKSTLNQESTLPANRASDGTSETLLDSMLGVSELNPLDTEYNVSALYATPEAICRKVLV